MPIHPRASPFPELILILRYGADALPVQANMTASEKEKLTDEELTAQISYV